MHMDDDLSQCVFCGISSRLVDIVPLESMNVSIRIEWRVSVGLEVPNMVDPLFFLTGQRVTISD